MVAAGLFVEPDPGLADTVVRLRRWRADDAVAVHEACQDPEIGRWIPEIPNPYTLNDAEAFVGGIGRDAWDAGKQSAFAIVDPATDRLLGAIGLHAHEARRWEIGYWVAPWARRKGVAVHAVRLLSRWAIREYALLRLSLHVLDGNEASERTAVAAGFRREGVLRNGIDGRHGATDLVMFSLVPQDLTANVAPVRRRPR